MSHDNTFRRQLEMSPLFAGLPDLELDDLAAAAVEKRYAKDEVIFLRGDRPTGVFIVMAGMVKMACQSPQGSEKVIDLVTPGQVFGEAALILDHAYPYMAAALSSVRLMHVDGKTLIDLVAGSAMLSRRLLAQLSKCILTGLRDLEDYRVRTPLERLIGYLHDQSTGMAKAKPVVVLEAPKHVIASRLSMTPEALSRGLRDLSDSGLIEVGPDHVKVLDRERLSRFNEGV